MDLFSLLFSYLYFCLGNGGGFFALRVWDVFNG